MTGGFFMGRIDEVHLYSRALTAAESRLCRASGPHDPVRLRCAEPAHERHVTERHADDVYAEAQEGVRS